MGGPLGTYVPESQWDIPLDYEAYAAVGAVLPASGQTRLTFDVTPPASTGPGQWWALVRVAAAGELLYSPAVRVTVR